MREFNKHQAECWLILVFKKSLFIYFNWRLITLQYCRGFCHTSTWISHRCTCIPHQKMKSQFPCYKLTRCYFMINKSWKTEYSCMHSIEENQRMQKLALKNEHFSVSVLNSQLIWVKLSLEVKGFHRITHIMLKLVLEPTWMPEHISYKLIFITNAFHICYKQIL